MIVCRRNVFKNGRAKPGWPRVGLHDGFGDAGAGNKAVMVGGHLPPEKYPGPGENAIESDPVAHLDRA